MPSFRRTIPVDTEDRATLEIVVGHGQIGRSLVVWDGDAAPAGFDDSFTFDLGGDLAGRSVRCSTLVYDVRTQTNHTRVDYTLICGGRQVRETREATVAVDFDIVLYTAHIRFVARR